MLEGKIEYLPSHANLYKIKKLQKSPTWKTLIVFSVNDSGLK